MVKAKPVGDFRKKKVKVGRKVEKANITDIKVKAKKIYIPSQNNITALAPDTEQSTLNQIIKQIQHYSESNRIAALRSLKDFLSKTENSERYISVVLPIALDRMFDEEKDSRVVLLDVIHFVTMKFSKSSLEAVIQVVVTYICSGITNIHRGIRKDTLKMLLCFIENCNSLLQPYKEKILALVISHLMEAFQSTTAESLGRKTNVSSDTNMREKSYTIKLKINNKTGDPTVTIFTLVLKVLKILLKGSMEEKGQNSNIFDFMNQGEVIEFEKQNNFVFLTSRRRSSILFESSTFSASSDKINDFSSLCLDIIEKLGKIWVGLTLNESTIPKSTIQLLKTIINIYSSIWHNKVSFDVHLALKTTCAQQIHDFFPYYCTEALVAVPGSKEFFDAQYEAEGLNGDICEISSVFGRYDVTKDFLCSSLERQLNLMFNSMTHLEENESNLAHSAEIIAKLFKVAKPQTDQLDLNIAMPYLNASIEILKRLKSNIDAAKYMMAAVSAVIRFLHSVMVTLEFSEVSSDFVQFCVLIVETVLDLPVLLEVFEKLDENLLSLAINSLFFLTKRNFFPVLKNDEKMVDSMKLKLGERVLMFFQLSDVLSTKSNNNFLSYLTCTTEYRYKLLDIFYHAEFKEKTLEISSQILRYLSFAKIDNKERSYFLVLLHERHTEMPTKGFAELLLISIRWNLQSHCKISKKLKFNESIIYFTKDWYANDVAKLFSWISSSNQPEKIVFFLKPMLDIWFEDIENSKKLNGNEGTVAQELGFLDLYGNLSGYLSIIDHFMRIIHNFINFSEERVNVVEEAFHFLITTFSKLTVMIVTNPVFQNLVENSPTETFKILKPFIKTLSLPFSETLVANLCDSQDSQKGVPGIPLSEFACGITEFPLFRFLLWQFSRHWQLELEAKNHEVCEQVLKGLKVILGSNLMDLRMVVGYQKEVEKWLEVMGDLTRSHNKVVLKLKKDLKDSVSRSVKDISFEIKACF